MKDLISKLQMDATCAMGAIWMHIDAREKRIAELEAQQAFGIGETYANALSRIAELEAQIAAASAQVVEPKYTFSQNDDKGCYEVRDILRNHVADIFYRSDMEAFQRALGAYVALQSADTDKLREAIAGISNNAITEAWESCGGVDGFYKSFGYQQFAHAVLDLAADTIASTALQAPVREVPDMRPGIEAVVALIQKQCDDYHREHGSQEPDTGVWNYPGDGNEWMCDREELLDEIRALLPAAPVQEPKP